MDDKGNAKVLTFGDRFRVRRDWVRRASLLWYCRSDS